MNRNTRVILQASIASFGVYFCMYAFRKPFTAGTFDIPFAGEFSYKSFLIICQSLGYLVSKLIGVKLISELKEANRITMLLGAVGIAELALLCFAITPAPWNGFFLFINGLPLGLVWGIVFSYLEGREQTEALTAGLSVSFIIASGFVKTVGAWLMLNLGISEFWMPFTTGLVFVVPLLLFSYLLNKIPERSKRDIAMRTERIPMKARARKVFTQSYFWGIVWMVSLYMLLTMARDFRDLFAAELWIEMGYGNIPSIFTTSELIITLILLASMIGLMYIRNNRTAYQIIHRIVAFGLALAGLSTILFQMEYINGFLWMVLAGTGIFMGYVPFNTIMFDRLIALIQRKSNVGFLIYIADTTGYFGSMGLLLYKEFSNHEMNWTEFISFLTLSVTLGGLLLNHVAKR